LGVIDGASRMIASEVTGVPPVRRDKASPAKQGERQEYIVVLSLHRQLLQNKQYFHNLYAYLSAARNSGDNRAGCRVPAEFVGSNVLLYPTV
jgi:hypothetical protein